MHVFVAICLLQLPTLDKTNVLDLTKTARLKPPPPQHLCVVQAKLQYNRGILSPGDFIWAQDKSVSLLLLFSKSVV